MSELTGNIKFRKALFGKVILQVEEKIFEYDNNTCHGETSYKWRDALYEDLDSIVLPSQEDEINRLRSALCLFKRDMQEDIEYIDRVMGTP